MPIHVTSYREADRLLRRPDLAQALYDEAAILMAKVLVNLHGDEHRRRRNVESRVFRRDFFRYYEEKVFPGTLAETLAPFVLEGRADLVDFGYRVMLNLTADFAGIDRLERSAAETAHLLKLLRSFAKAPTLGQTSADKEPIRREIAAALEEFDTAFFTPSMQRRQELIDLRGAASRDDLDHAGLPRDILSMLLLHAADVDLPHDILMKEMAFFVLAGAFTSIHSFTHAMHEIFEWCRRNPDAAMRPIEDPIFLQRCALESMRLHPSSPTASRRPTHPIALDGHGEIGPEDKIVIDLLAANRDVSVFGRDAAEYNPARTFDRQTGPYGLSFGMGAHSCIGRNLASGVVPADDTDPANHHYGTITLILQALLVHGARPHPDDRPRMDTTSTRPNWGYYPVLLNETTHGDY